MRIGIHQINFCPWQPFFDKMRSCDVFVLMSHCQFEKGGYQSRFQYNDEWFSMRTGSGIMNICDKQYIDAKEDFKRIKSRLPKVYATKLSIFDYYISNNLRLTNEMIINHAARLLGIKTKIEYDYPTNLKSSERLLDICKHFGATEYLSGVSGKNYLDTKIFEESKIKVKFQKETQNKKALIEIL